MNYGEELTYWYLRLNGFFPISRYMIHRTEEGRHPSDRDLLAVRFPHPPCVGTTPVLCQVPSWVPGPPPRAWGRPGG